MLQLYEMVYLYSATGWYTQKHMSTQDTTRFKLWQQYNRYDRPDQFFQEQVDLLVSKYKPDDLEQIARLFIEIAQYNLVHNKMRPLVERYGEINTRNVPQSVSEFSEFIRQGKPTENYPSLNWFSRQPEKCVFLEGFEDISTRVITNCRGKCLFVSAALKYLGYFVRMRSGATYLDFLDRYVQHEVIEVSENGQEFILLDADNVGMESMFIHAIDLADKLSRDILGKDFVLGKKGLSNQNALYEPIIRDIKELANIPFPYHAKVYFQGQDVDKIENKTECIEAILNQLVTDVLSDPDTNIDKIKEASKMFTLDEPRTYNSIT